MIEDTRIISENVSHKFKDYQCDDILYKCCKNKNGVFIKWLIKNYGIDSWSPFSDDHMAHYLITNINDFNGLYYDYFFDGHNILLELLNESTARFGDEKEWEMLAKFLIEKYTAHVEYQMMRIKFEFGSHEAACMYYDDHIYNFIIEEIVRFKAIKERKEIEEACGKQLPSNKVRSL